MDDHRSLSPTAAGVRPATSSMSQSILYGDLSPVLFSLYSLHTDYTENTTSVVAETCLLLVA
jgi:hypothetical protein